MVAAIMLNEQSRTVDTPGHRIWRFGGDVADCYYNSRNLGSASLSVPGSDAVSWGISFPKILCSAFESPGTTRLMTQYHMP